MTRVVTYSPLRRRVPPAVDRGLRFVRHPGAYKSARRIRGKQVICDCVNAGALFVHVPKTAGRSVADGVFGRPLPHYPIDLYRLVFSPKEIDRLFVFAFVRDPVDRTRSAFQYLPSSPAAHDRRWADAHLRPYKSLDAFVLHHLADPDVQRQLHFRPQANWICAGRTGMPAVDFVGRFERLQDDYKVICDELGITAELPAINRSPPTEASLALSDRAVERIYDV
ncbi:MAG: sulfotransferase family 2 domain-containing protein, partial [Actinomycetota bacterium]